MIGGVTATPSPSVRRCTPALRDAALATVLSAFAADELLRWVWPEDDRYALGAAAMFGLLLDLRIEAGEVSVASCDPEAKGVDSVHAVAMWDPPGGLALPNLGQRWAEVHAGSTSRERECWAAYDETMKVPADAGPHWYLGVIATAPAHQGTGLGRAVTAPVLAGADGAGLPAYLETTTAGNVTVYRRLGFEVVREEDVPGGGPHGFVMRREPRTPGPDPSSADVRFRS